ncbi:MAG: Prolipoprotein diacylglyceryl transferase [Myxococcota bacterium]|nr:Prolipoprotein diacylglyceryl transferase [Myxococcota bacterium]
MHPVLWEFQWKMGERVIHPRFYSYGFLLAVAILLGVWWMQRLVEMRNGDRERAVRAVYVIIGLALMGSRILFIITNWEMFAPRFPASALSLQIDGVVAYGGFLGGLLGAVIATRWQKIPFWNYADACCPPLALGLALVRVGCFLAGCDFGAPTQGPMGISFPPSSPAAETHLQRGLIAAGQASLPVHPTQLYESAAGFVLAAVLWMIYRKSRVPGRTMLAFWGLYGLWRFAIEFVRDDPQRGELLGLSTSQIIALLTAPAAAAAWVWLGKHPREAWGWPQPAASKGKGKNSSG